jgi:hypothetical protein
MLFSALRSRGFAVVFVPSLMMVNREECGWFDFFGWVSRQLLTARLYHPFWPAVLFHGFAIPLVLAVACGVGMLAVVLGRWEAVITIGIGLVLYYLAMVALLIALEAGVRCAVHHRGEPMNWITIPIATRIAVTIPITQIVYAAAVVAAATMRTTRWRSITYRINGPFEIRRTDYRPHASSADSGCFDSL